MNSYGFISDSIVDAKANAEDGDIETTISDDRLGTTNVPLACSNSDDPLSTVNAPLAQNKVVDEEPLVGMQFEDNKCAYKFYSSYAQKIGFRVRKLPIGKCPTSGVIQRREFCCARRMKGLYSPELGRCDAHMKCRLENGKFTVISFNKEHNHNIFPFQSSLDVQLSIAQVDASLKRSGKVNNAVQIASPMQNIETLSREPRAFLFHDFLSKEECEHMIQLGQPHLKRSLVSDKLTGKNIESSARTSFGAWVRRGNDHIVTNIEKRIAEATFLPLEHGEDFNVLRYEVGQKTEPHYDTFNNIFDHIKQNGGQRVATFLMYLSEVEEGGETIFPRAKGKVTTVPWCDGSSQNFKSGVVVKPKMGNAVFFWHVKPDGTLDQDSLHCGSPVVKGNKWCCTKFIRAGVYNVNKAGLPNDGMSKNSQVVAPI